MPALTRGCNFSAAGIAKAHLELSRSKKKPRLQRRNCAHVFAFDQRAHQKPRQRCVSRKTLDQYAHSNASIHATAEKRYGAVLVRG